MRSHLQRPRLRLGWSVLRDSSAQALVEFALVIPLLLLLFFSMIQGLLIAQAAQLGNYAAYAAARVYAVRSGVSGLDETAKDYAKKAAALVYAPVAKLAPNEVAVLPDGLSSLLPGGLPSFVEKAAEVGEGFLTAYYLRLSSAGGGDFRIETSDSSDQFRVELDFAYPIFLPGLAEAWSLVSGERNMKTHLQDMGVASNTLLATLISPYPYVIIKSKCAMGYERWSGSPRKPQTTKPDAAIDTELTKRQKEMEEAQGALKKAQEKESKEYNEYCAAKAEADAACNKAATNPDDEDAQIDCQTKTAKKDQEYQDYLNARAERISACEHLAAVSEQDLKCEGEPGDCT
jgi:hypothetical protein